MLHLIYATGKSGIRFVIKLDWECNWEYRYIQARTFLHYCTQQRATLNFTCIPVRYASRPISKSVPVARHHTSSTHRNLLTDCIIHSVIGRPQSPMIRYIAAHELRRPNDNGWLDAHSVYDLAHNLRHNHPEIAQASANKITKSNEIWAYYKGKNSSCIIS